MSSLKEAHYFGRTAHVAFLGIHRALDALPHEALPLRRSQCGVSGRALAYLKAFLVGRSLQVRLACHPSTPRLVCEGGPQGSVLSAMFFVTAVAGLLDCLPAFKFPKVRLALYAYDVVLMSSLTNQLVRLSSGTSTVAFHILNLGVEHAG